MKALNSQRDGDTETEGQIEGDIETEVRGINEISFLGRGGLTNMSAFETGGEGGAALGPDIFAVSVTHSDVVRVGGGRGFNMSRLYCGCVQHRTA